MAQRTDVYIIHHGEAWDSKTQVIVGALGDEGLTPLGREQSGSLRERLAATGEIKADVLLSSTYPRARQTAEIIAPALNLPIIFDDDLQGIRPGDADGLSREEFNATYGQTFSLSDPFGRMAPNAETWPEFAIRVSDALYRITSEFAGKTIVLISHASFLQGVFVYFFHMNPVGAWPLDQVQNTSITHWGRDLTFNDARSQWRLLRYNDDAHLTRRWTSNER
ncbi:MAG TPA: histidine phosphatase family protein [Chloroflexia bacterium]|nr:histidine phosphatase family protein [Chloroflexia bacterium]